MSTSSAPGRSPLTFALLAATTMIAQQVAGKATRDALFLSNFDVTELPKVVIAAAIASITGVLIMSRLLSHHGPFRVVPMVFGFSALLFCGEWLLLPSAPGITSILLYLHMSVFGAILISGFWSLINERFDPHTAKQRVARIAAATTFGGIVGGVLAERVTALTDVRTMLLFLSGLHLLCVASVRAIGKPETDSHEDSQVEARSAFEIIKRTGYLQWMAALMILIAIIAGLLDYAFKAEASARYQSSESLVGFFASFYASVGVISFLMQTLLGPKMLHRYGISATLAILPAMVVAFGSLSTILPRLWTLVLARGGHAVFVTSFYRSAFELLYTPLSPQKKRPTKTIIDVASDRTGDLLASGLLLLLLALIPELPTAIVTGCAVLAALIALFIISRLHRGYIDQLASSLRKGAVTLDSNEVVDATTQKILAESSAESEREMIQSRLDAMDASADTSGDASLTDAVAHLSSCDPSRIRTVLQGGLMDVRLTPWLVPLLASEELHEDVRTELRWLVPRIVGQLTDALLDPDIPLVARQRLPGVLEASHGPRIIDALLLGIEDEEFVVRFSCARALARMRSRNKKLAFEPEAIFSAIRHEVDCDADNWRARNMMIPTDQNHAALEHVFTLLTLILDAGATHTALQALFSTDINMRGTALEYLENVLPDDIYHLVRARIRESESGRAT